MPSAQNIVLIVGSGPNAPQAAAWPRRHFDDIIALNNAWRIRPDWSHHIHPEDLPQDRRPPEVSRTQTIVTHQDYVPANNTYGGVLFAGATMAFSAAYWALATRRPKILAMMGCDMVYARTGNTHFYGKGSADPLRDDITLQSLEAKSARLWLIAAQQGCFCVNLSQDPSRLLFPRAQIESWPELAQLTDHVLSKITELRAREQALGYDVPSGRYWHELERFEPEKLADIDQLWLDLYHQASVIVPQ